jgi:hypothetical protein
MQISASFFSRTLEGKKNATEKSGLVREFRCSDCFSFLCEIQCSDCFSFLCEITLLQIEVNRSSRTAKMVYINVEEVNSGL